MNMKLYILRLTTILFLCSFYSCSINQLFKKDQKVITINRKYVDKEMQKSSLSVIFSQNCGYCLLLNQYFNDERICSKYQVSINIIDVTHLDSKLDKENLPEWGKYAECAIPQVLSTDPFIYKFDKLRPIIFFKNHKGSITKIRGFNKEKLNLLLANDLKEKVNRAQ